MSVVANATFGQEVFRADGTRLYGLDAEVERKVKLISVNYARSGLLFGEKRT